MSIYKYSSVKVYWDVPLQVFAAAQKASGQVKCTLTPNGLESKQTMTSDHH